MMGHSEALEQFFKHQITYQQFLASGAAIERCGHLFACSDTCLTITIEDLRQRLDIIIGNRALALEWLNVIALSCYVKDAATDAAIAYESKKLLLGR